MIGTSSETAADETLGDQTGDFSSQTVTAKAANGLHSTTATFGSSIFRATRTLGNPGVLNSFVNAAGESEESASWNVASQLSLFALRRGRRHREKGIAPGSIAHRILHLCSHERLQKPTPREAETPHLGIRDEAEIVIAKIRIVIAGSFSPMETTAYGGSDEAMPNDEEMDRRYAGSEAPAFYSAHTTSVVTPRGEEPKQKARKVEGGDPLSAQVPALNASNPDLQVPPDPDGIVTVMAMGVEVMRWKPTPPT